MRHPKEGINAIATKAAIAQPKVKPPTAAVNIFALILAGANSEMSVMVRVNAPPNPKPHRKRRIQKTKKLGAKKAIPLKIENIATANNKIFFLPMRSDAIPKAMAPNISPKKP